MVTDAGRGARSGFAVKKLRGNKKEPPEGGSSLMTGRRQTERRGAAPNPETWTYKVNISESLTLH
jgi:hypothetical protein